MRQLFQFPSSLKFVSYSTSGKQTEGRVDAGWSPHTRNKEMGPLAHVLVTEQAIGMF